MKNLFWLVGLAAVAVAVALLMGQNGATVTVFWHPYRVDMSFNLLLAAAVLLFVLLYLALRSVALLGALPQQARLWRLQQRERLAHAALLDALSHQLAGRFVRAGAAARDAVSQLQGSNAAHGGAAVPRQAQMLALAHLLAAESAHTLQNHSTRDQHLAQALAPGVTGSDAATTREGALLRAIRWAVEERNVAAATRWLDQLPQGASRRTLALRLKLRVARLAQDNPMALETARLLAKHRAFSPPAARSIVRGLVLAVLKDTHDIDQVQSAWANLDANDRRDPDVVLAIAQRMHDVTQGSEEQVSAHATARQWVLPVWDGYSGLSPSHQVAVVRLLQALGTAGDVGWLARIENMQRQQPADPLLQYLAAETFFQRRLWGKSAQLFQQAVRSLPDTGLRSATWCRLAQLAEERGDTDAALSAWRQAALAH